MRCPRRLRVVAAASVVAVIGVLGTRGPDAALSRSVAMKPAVTQLVAAAGDIACDPSILETASACHQRETSNLLLRKRYSAVLALGDEQYETGAYAAFLQVYDPSWGRLKTITHPVPGNHEYASDPTGYFRYFGDAAGKLGQGWYSFNLGAWHLIALNSNCRLIGGCEAGTLEGDWLRQDLARDRKPCTLAFFHHPLFTSEIGAVTDVPEISALWQALYAAHVDLVVNGHSHSYERFAPLDPNGNLDAQHGIRELVVGTGGDDLTGLRDPRAPNSKVSSASTFGILSLKLNNASYSWRFIPEAGSAFTDSGSRACYGGGKH